MNKNISVLKNLAILFHQNNVTWKLVGSTNLALQGVDVAANDIDISTTPKDIYKIDSVLKEFVVEPIQNKKFKVFEGLFGIYKKENVSIDVFANVNAVGRNSPPIDIKLDDVIIPCASLEEEIAVYEKLDRQDKVLLIKRAL